MLHHPQLERRPKISFKIIKTYKDPLSRLIAESVLIDKLANLNSKSEWRNNRESRLVVETVERKKDVTEKRRKQEEEEWLFNKKVEELESKMKGRNRNTDEDNNNTSSLNCRKKTGQDTR